MFVENVKANITINASLIKEILGNSNQLIMNY